MHSLTLACWTAARDDEQFTVLRLTLGIPGFDEAQLPRVIAALCLGLLAINRVASSGAPSAAQVRGWPASVLAVCRQH